MFFKKMDLIPPPSSQSVRLGCTVSVILAYSSARFKESRLLQTQNTCTRLADIECQISGLRTRIRNQPSTNKFSAFSFINVQTFRKYLGILRLHLYDYLYKKGKDPGRLTRWIRGLIQTEPGSYFYLKLGPIAMPIDG